MRITGKKKRKTKVKTRRIHLDKKKYQDIIVKVGLNTQNHFLRRFMSRVVKANKSIFTKLAIDGQKGLGIQIAKKCVNQSKALKGIES